MDVYHIDGLRVDAVYSMLTLNFDRSEEDRITNNEGGEENLEGIAFLQKLNAVVFARYPNALMMAEDSSSFPGVTKPVEQGGLGFNYKWNLSFTWNTLDYMKKNQEQRSGLEPQLTKSLQQAWDENYILPYAHDEMANPDKSLLGKMSGSDSWQRFANLRVLYAYLIGHPGKSSYSWAANSARSRSGLEAALTWDVLQDSEHEQFKHFVKTLNHFTYRRRLYGSGIMRRMGLRALILRIRMTGWYCSDGKGRRKKRSSWSVTSDPKPTKVIASELRSLRNTEKYLTVIAQNSADRE